MAAITTAVTVLPFTQWSLVHISSYYVPGTYSLEIQPSEAFPVLQNFCSEKNTEESLEK